MIKSNIRKSLAVALTFAAFGSPLTWAAPDSGVRVFPVKAFFYDASEESSLDPQFRLVVETQTPAVLGNKVSQALTEKLNGLLGPLDRRSVGHTFAVSFHVPRATSYSVNKGNGNSDLITSITASLYFTNILTGEIFTTISKSVVGITAITNNARMDEEKAKLFTQTLDSLISQLTDDASKNFRPTVIDTKITDRVQGLFILDSGFSKGFQVGDQIESSSGEIIKIVYAAKNYSVAENVLADNVKEGAVFHKYLVHSADGKIKPRTVVLVEDQPKGFDKNMHYIGQLFSELVGDTAPLSVIQVNPSFSLLLQTVAQQSSLTTNDTKSRVTPDLFIRLRVAEPIIYEVKTNLEFKTIRHYETLAFADIIDSTGRVNFSVVGKDEINDEITNNVGPGPVERREVSIKNALLDLANKLSKLSEPKVEQSPVVAATPSEASIANSGNLFSPKQKGTVLRQLNVRLGSGTQKIWMPILSAKVVPELNSGKVHIERTSPLVSGDENIHVADVFEIQRIGPTPLSSNVVSVCEKSESLGTILTPSLLNITSNVLGSKMPSMLYAPSVQSSALKLINSTNGFKNNVKWEIPTIGMCIQPVERVTTAADQCDTQCERPITARYTIRVKKGDEVISRSIFEGQFKSTGFYKQNDPSQINALINSDLIDEAKNLLSKAVEKIVF